ncbi:MULTISPECIES: hypothetical protein [Ehrlichia]|uniref:Uncharacterized protein n=1 Tax=Ehrlichia cf. muris str. EmCRT TaxID=1359167 RepID=A0A0F3NC00_9RICK|nr:MULTISPECIES: hypothetical protein [Ehrlichia]KJV65593.1 hypothetical protein EMUCRT_0538 [Ehrlichia cf. muris str. EmCRT]OUC04463.1 hypothetical protein DB91_02755 [Ehrlichia sp. Wisconsin_h]
MAAKEEVLGDFRIALEESSPQCDKNLLQVTYAMNCMLDRFQGWKDAHPKCHIIDYGIYNMCCAILLSRAINMYQDNKKLTSAEEHQLEKLGILRETSNKCTENVIRYDISQLVKHASDCFRYVNTTSKEGINTLYYIEQTFKLFKSGMQAIEKQEAAGHEQVSIMKTRTPLLVKTGDDTQFPQVYPVISRELTV